MNIAKQKYYENEIKKKLTAKVDNRRSEMTLVMKLFKYYDMGNSGLLSLDEFLRVLASIGVHLDNKNDGVELFEIYSDENNKLNYKEFAEQILNDDELQTPKHYSPNKLKMNTVKPNFERHINSVKEILEKVRHEFRNKHGALALLNLALNLKENEISSSYKKSVTVQEFSKAIKKTTLNINPFDTNKIFDYLDKRNRGIVEIDEIINFIKGELTDLRKQLIQNLFNQLEKNSKVFFSQLMERYEIVNISEILHENPDNISKNFLTLTQKYAIYRNIKKNGSLTPEQFEEFLSFISFTFEPETSFKTYMVVGFKLGEKAQEKKKEIPNYSIKEEHFNETGFYSKKKENTEKEIIGKDQIPTEFILKSIKDKILKLGINSMLNLKKFLKNVDLDNDFYISYKEFRRVLKDMRIEISELEIQKLVEYFTERGKISCTKILDYFVEKPNELRSFLINQVFDKLDTDKDHIVTLSELKSGMFAREHPEVKLGKKIEHDIVTEIIESIKNYKIINGNSYDVSMNGLSLTLNRNDVLEFFRYYSASIPDDNYFEKIMIGVFRLVGHNSLANNYNYAGTSKNSSQHGFTNNSRQNFIQMIYKANTFGGTVCSNAPFGTYDNPVEYSTAIRTKNDSPFKETLAKTQSPKKFNISMTKEKQENYQKLNLIEAFQKKLKQRGEKSLANLDRIFNEIDEDKSGFISYEEFANAIENIRLDFPEESIIEAFKIFDKNSDGHISHEEFISCLRGDLEERRKSLIKQAWSNLQKIGKGQVTFETIKNTYNAKRHPDVLERKKNEDEMISDFIDSFEMYISALRKDEKLRDKKVSFNEFFEYYYNISSCIENFEKFEKIICGCWNLNFKEPEKDKNFLRKVIKYPF